MHEARCFFALNHIIFLANQNENEIILSITFHGLIAQANQIAEKYKAKKVIWGGGEGNFAILALLRCRNL